MCLVKLSSVDTGMGVCMSSSTTSLVCVCNGNDPGSANKIRARDVCVFVQARETVGMGVCLPYPVSTRHLFVCMYVYVF